MHPTLQELINELSQLSVAVQSYIPSDEPFSVAHSNWTFPGISRRDLVLYTQELIDQIRTRGADELGANDLLIKDYVRRLAFLRSNVIQNIWGGAAQGVPAFFETLQGLKRALSTALREDELKSLIKSAAQLKDADPGEIARLASQLRARLRVVESRLTAVEPRSASLESMVKRIEDAYDLAQQGDADLEAIREAKRQSLAARDETVSAKEKASQAKTDIEEAAKKLRQAKEDAEKVLAKCDEAYSAATSQGLAKAFYERSESLSNSMWIWVLGLMAALVIGGIVGTDALRDLTESLKDPQLALGPTSMRLSIALLTVGGPIWFAWLATKQIGQRFKLAEDYAFKASVSKAYAGYRAEAARFDREVELQLFSSALTRLDELPLRLVEPATHGSPWQELLTSGPVSDALRRVPGFGASAAETLKALAASALSTLQQGKHAIPPRASDSNAAVPPQT